MNAPLGLLEALELDDPLEFLEASPTTPAIIPAWLHSLIDSIAFGVVLLDSQRRVLMCNREAIRSLHECGQSLNLGQVIPWVSSAQGNRIQRALMQSCAGWRRMLLLQGDSRRHIVSLSPVPLDDGSLGILLTTEKYLVCTPNTIACYANLCGLTAAESNVLAALASGATPTEAADRLNNSIATVRSHIKSILTKTESECLRSLIVKLAKLPPMVDGNNPSETFS
jgi:DNA-binding CsgD family transcriptional regulator